MKSAKTIRQTVLHPLQEVLPGLGEAYKAWKSWEADKNRHKDEFFELANQAVTAEGLAERVVSYPALNADEAEVRAARHNPGWRVVEARPHPEKNGCYEFILQEDPTTKTFSHEVEGVKYVRQVSKGPILVDEEWLCEEDEDLYEKTTVALPWGDRIMVPLNLLEPESLSQLSKYIYNGKPKVQLAPPRPVKESE